ncbi:integumentary mucin A.1-like [Palaemon carinicauda]|uniref:integumentary mucin A.1-like n=1 Tax=Palaemon carinicauda TaxID=392227 RepID=UPI0035B601C1
MGLEESLDKQYTLWRYEVEDSTSRDHNHAGGAEKVYVLQAKNKITEKASTTSETPAAIISEVISQVPECSQPLLPTTASMTRNVRKLRSKQFPTLPTSLADVDVQAKLTPTTTKLTPTTTKLTPTTTKLTPTTTKRTPTTTKRTPTTTKRTLTTTKRTLTTTKRTLTTTKRTLTTTKRTLTTRTSTPTTTTTTTPTPTTSTSIPTRSNKPMRFDL